MGTANILDYKDLDTSWKEQIKSRLLTARTPSVAILVRAEIEGATNTVAAGIHS